MRNIWAHNTFKSSLLNTIFDSATSINTDFSAIILTKTSKNNRLIVSLDKFLLDICDSSYTNLKLDYCVWNCMCFRIKRNF